MIFLFKPPFSPAFPPSFSISVPVGTSRDFLTGTRQGTALPSPKRSWRRLDPIGLEWLMSNPRLMNHVIVTWILAVCYWTWTIEMVSFQKNTWWFSGSLCDYRRVCPKLVQTGIPNRSSTIFLTLSIRHPSITAMFLFTMIPIDFN